MSKDCVIVFEDEHYKGFYPLSISHPTFDILVGSKTNLARIEHHFGEFKIAKRCRPQLSHLFNGLTDDEVTNLSQGHIGKLILINGRAVFRKRDSDFINGLKEENDCVAYVKNGTLVAANLPSEFIRPFSEDLLLLSHDGFSHKIIEKSNETKDAPEELKLFSHIWEPMLENQEIIKEDFDEYYKD